MEYERAASAFSVLGLPARVDILRYLLKHGAQGVAAGELAARLGTPPPTMSFHLKELVNAGLAVSRRAGRNVFYRADYAGIRALIEFLLEDCCQGDPRLCGPYVIRENAE